MFSGKPHPPVCCPDRKIGLHLAAGFDHIDGRITAVPDGPEEGSAQALYDFSASLRVLRDGLSELPRGGDSWGKWTNARSEAAQQRFESALYA